MGDDFLARWSRRKRGTEPERVTEPAPEPPEDPDRDGVAPAQDAGPAETEAELLQRLALKHPDEMTRGDDFSAFLRAEVPRHLRTMALRRLWRSDPTLACLDGLNDYDGDFTGGGVKTGSLKTSYQVGRGFARKVAGAALEPECGAEPVDADPPDGADNATGAAPEGRGQTPAAAQDEEIADAAALLPDADATGAAPEGRGQTPMAGLDEVIADAAALLPDAAPPRATRRRMVFKDPESQQVG